MVHICFTPRLEKTLRVKNLGVGGRSWRSYRAGFKRKLSWGCITLRRELTFSDAILIGRGTWEGGRDCH